MRRGPGRGEPRRRGAATRRINHVRRLGDCGGADRLLSCRQWLPVDARGLPGHSVFSSSRLVRERDTGSRRPDDGGAAVANSRDPLPSVAPSAALPRLRHCSSDYPSGEWVLDRRITSLSHRARGRLLGPPRLFATTPRERGRARASTLCVRVASATNRGNTVPRGLSSDTSLRENRARARRGHPR